ncbi:MAG: hypothetical protein D6696_11825 [Acidobacteria bacterium]|nr:MAG: hypothetical protein D6696_11825 [Acidobacteriota bacterium]
MSPAPPTWRIRLTRALLLALIAWAGGRLLAEAYDTARTCRFNHPPATFTDRWRVGSRDWQQLADFAGWLELVVPEGGVVAFRAWPDNRRLAWNAAYLLPRHEIVPVERGWSWHAADYAVMFRGTWDHPRLELIFEHPSGRIYRIRRPP